jgi:hypothetical protein
MTSTLKSFVTRLEALRGASISIKFADGPPLSATIPAKNENVGDMVIYDDGDELTVEIGHKHHTHISSYTYESYPAADRLDMVARDAAEFVDDVMRDRVCITVDFRGDRCIGSSHYYLAEGKKQFPHGSRNWH